ncbi:hypothetical protein DMB42_11705 [Nonomuraea sp. WAC 01424]|uniref:hypothetical protein n=1 Tax=Nonomuraea sp. WAC 01424 TaxID=2203200 RepID=UPI000F7913FC|nr:hypothetical protein [Nonomuraea sp. WAC 01424]RSN12836.1 hypothetical protein DMB42_11705 [Nonomuraea sp. WAC 01424]
MADVARETYTDRGPKDANPCTECGMSDWWCLYDINRGAGRCCIWCGLADVHGVTAPSPDGASVEERDRG